MFFGNLNFIFIIVATIVGMGVGAIWYSPFVFGPLWIKSKGWTKEDVMAHRNSPMLPQMSIMTLGTFVTALMLAALFNSLVVTGISGILFVGLCVWLGFAVPVKLGDYLFGGDSFTFFLLSIGHQFVVTMIMSAIVGIFG